MTERQAHMLHTYLPHRRDPELLDNEYYVMDLAGRVQKVRITDICPGRGSGTVYGVVMAKSGRRVDPGYDYGFHMSELYDNQQDCRDMTHSCYNQWEELRELESEEVNQ